MIDYGCASQIVAAEHGVLSGFVMVRHAAGRKTLQSS